MIPLRIALGVVAVLALVAAGLGACMSVKINWEFAQTLGRNSEWGFYLALAFASIEGVRLLVPFLHKGLHLSGMKAMARWMGVAFCIFTLASVISAAGFFAMNRSDSTAQRSAQMSQTQIYRVEVETLAARMQRNASTRSVGEIDADLKPLPKGDPERIKLDKEKAAAIQRDKDAVRLEELRRSDGWKTAISAAITSKDTQIEMIADAMPWFDKATSEKYAAIALILVVIIALELLVGLTPFAAVMVLVWAVRSHKGTDTTSGAGYTSTDRPPKNDAGLSNEHAENPGKSGSTAVLDNPKATGYTTEEAKEDVTRWLAMGSEIPSATVLQLRWKWSNQTTLRKLKAWRDEGLLRLEKRGNRMAILPAKQMERPTMRLVQATA